MSRLRAALPDGLAVALLLALWLLFFWRLFTPVATDQASLRLGDFSGQFVAFAGYQANRMCAGEWPLWNPYNNAGFPFAADTQAAVFYPPRWATIGLSCAGGFSYHALELEMAAHVLFAALTMYALGRRLTKHSAVSVPAALLGAVVFAYSGFLTGYPPLQLALLEAAVWLPLGVLAITEATRGPRPAWRWLIAGAMALGLSWLAGHPQTSYFLSLLLAAYLIYRAWVQRWRWPWVLASLALLAGLTLLLALALLLPGAEYLARTARTDLGFDAKANGFPLQDALQILFPGLLSLYSPLYVGFAAVALAAVALWRRKADAWFWGLTALVAFVWSLGANSPLYPLIYNTLPGLRFFRGQERAAFVWAGSLAVLASLGLAALPALAHTHDVRRLRRVLWAAAAFVLVVVGVVFAGWLGANEAYTLALPAVVLAALMVIATALLLPWLAQKTRSSWLFALVPLLAAFELFTVGMNAASTYESTPPGQQIAMTAEGNPLLEPMLADDAAFRVDGQRGLTDNYGSLWGVPDIHGISPLFLSSIHALIESDLPRPRLWELLAVRYVLSDWAELPVPAEIVAAGEDRYGPVNAHQVEDPRPFALLIPNYHVASTADEARALVFDPSITLRDTVILEQEPGIDGASGSGSAEITLFAPEEVRVAVSAEAPALLSLALVDYPGWVASVGGEPVPILRAYSALSAVVVPAGEHEVLFHFEPRTVQVGAAVSAGAWAVCLVLVLALFVLNRRRRAERQ